MSSPCEDKPHCLYQRDGVFACVHYSGIEWLYCVTHPCPHLFDNVNTHGTKLLPGSRKVENCRRYFHYHSELEGSYRSYHVRFGQGDRVLKEAFCSLNPCPNEHNQVACPTTFSLPPSGRFINREPSPPPETGHVGQPYPSPLRGEPSSLPASPIASSSSVPLRH